MMGPCRLYAHAEVVASGHLDRFMHRYAAPAPSPIAHACKDSLASQAGCSVVSPFLHFL